MRASPFLSVLPAALLVACGPDPTPEERAAAIDAFAIVYQVFQHPRCRNCHIPGDAPLQFDAGLPHDQGVVRGPAGLGAPGLPCSTCHGEANPTASFGANAPPGAPHWALPPPERKMTWIGLAAPDLCTMIQDEELNGGRDLDDLLRHVSEDELVLWGWDPGGERAPVAVAHADFVAKFTQWAEAGGPCT